MSWAWEYRKADGTRVRTKHDRAEFASQGDAETFLGETWPELAMAGAEYAELFEHGRSEAHYSIPLPVESP